MKRLAISKAIYGVAFCGALTLGSLQAQAQVVALGTAQAGFTVTYGTAVAKVVTERAGLQMRTQALSSTGQYAPRVNAGELEFGMSNIIETTFSFQGKDMFEGKPNPNLRMAFNMFPQPIVFQTPQKVKISNPKDLLALRMPVGWNAQRVGDNIFRGFFANMNMSYEPAKGVPIPAMPRMWDLFGQGELDLVFSILNASLNKEMAVKVGGLSYISVNDDEAAVARMQPFLPGSYVTHDIDVETGNVVKNISFDFVVYTSTRVSEDIVYRVVKAIHQGDEQLRTYDGNWKPNLVKKNALEYHPGAIRYYKEAGIWKD